MSSGRFRIVGGIEHEGNALWPSRDDVFGEAGRRLEVLGYKHLKARALGTGTMIPASVRHLALQIEYVAEALARRVPIPDDFQSDFYWPHSQLPD